MDSGDEDFSYYDEVVDGDSRRLKHYKILKEEEIRQLQQNDISQVSNLLSVSRSLACTLLHRRNWSPISVLEEWFSGEETVRAAIGLPSDQEPPKPDIKTRCKICFNRFKKIENAMSTYCGHPFCRRCWKSYLSDSITDAKPLRAPTYSTGWRPMKRNKSTINTSSGPTSRATDA